MSLFPTWSRRKKQKSSDNSDPFSYDKFPTSLRVQVIHLVRKIEKEACRIGGGVISLVVQALREEFGVFTLYKGHFTTDRDEFEYWFLNENDIDRILDAIEIIFTIAPHVRLKWSAYDPNLMKLQIAEFNARMLEAGVGYQFEGTQIIQIADEFSHKEIVLPTLQLISESGYETVQKEFLAGHTAFRRGEYETAIVECCKALESTLKIIGSQRRWGTTEDASAAKLIGAAFDSGFIPAFMQNEFNALRAMLESSVPTKRNKAAAHGSGTAPRTVSISLARFQINQTAATIRFLVDLHRES